ncbi:Na+/H+ antiporter NhaA [Belnapia sp. T6]|uniref:Na(+)/H(+) antiporter NhaA n=1 Tax=Belnapia mucosa TaxID=2804532 RepID=A0ABS1V9V1_9PROT|nr:Na+/H+ antiporter NhaA [Belnapia mucosa]
MTKNPRSASLLRRLFAGSAAGGVVLMAAAAAALVLANSPLDSAYAAALGAYLGPLSLLHWVNDGLMAVFFLLVGLEIKREMVEGHLARRAQRVLPGLAAAGGMAVPALVFLFCNLDEPANRRGWAIPAATDIAFALGVLGLLGRHAPASLRVFLTALAILDNLGAVVIVALFYPAGLDTFSLGLAATVMAVLIRLNRAGVVRLLPYLLLGGLLWWFTLRSGVHATIAGVALAFAIPLRRDHDASPLHRLEHGLQPWAVFGILPVFGFANAGVSLAGVGLGALAAPLTLGVGLGLLLGKLVGVFGAAALAIRTGLAALPQGAGWWQLLGTALLCGIGLTMSLFIALLAFPDSPDRQAEVKIGILAGSLLAGLAGAAVLRLAPRRGGE